MTTEQDIDRIMMTLNIIWFALFSALAAYTAIGLLFLKNLTGVAMDPAQFNIIKIVFYGVSLPAVMAAGVFKRRVLSGKIGTRPVRKTANPAAQRYISAVALSLAICEIPAINGFILYVLGKNQRDLLLLIMFSAAAMLYNKPRREEFLAVIQAFSGAENTEG